MAQGEQRKDLFESRGGNLALHDLGQRAAQLVRQAFRESETRYRLPHRLPITIAR